MCSSHVWYYIFAYCVLYGARVLDRCDDYIICTTNRFIQISLGFRKWLVYKDFILIDTKLVVYLPWPSRKLSTIFISSDSKVVFLTCSILSANTDPVVCVDLAFWKKLKECFLYFFLKSLFWWCWAFCPLLCFGDWNKLPPADYQRVVQSWGHFCHRSVTRKVYTNSPRVVSRNRMHPKTLTTL